MTQNAWRTLSTENRCHLQPFLNTGTNSFEQPNANLYLNGIDFVPAICCVAPVERMLFHCDRKRIPLHFLRPQEFTYFMRCDSSDILFSFSPFLYFVYSIPMLTRQIQWIRFQFPHIERKSESRELLLDSFIRFASSRNSSNEQKRHRTILFMLCQCGHSINVLAAFHSFLHSILTCKFGAIQMPNPFIALHILQNVRPVIALVVFTREITEEFFHAFSSDFSCLRHHRLVLHVRLWILSKFCTEM